MPPSHCTYFQKDFNLRKVWTIVPTFYIENKKIADDDNDFILTPGQSVVVVSGLGGHSIRDQKRTGDWWASIYTSDRGAQSGALFCTFEKEEKMTQCQFKNISGEVVDEFVLRRE